MNRCKHCGEYIVQPELREWNLCKERQMVEEMRTMKDIIVSLLDAMRNVCDDSLREQDAIIEGMEEVQPWQKQMRLNNVKNIIEMNTERINEIKFF